VGADETCRSGNKYLHEYASVPRQAVPEDIRRIDRLGITFLRGHHLHGLLGAHEFHRECVLRNFPPAWVHHVRLSKT